MRLVRDALLPFVLLAGCTAASDAPEAANVAGQPSGQERPFRVEPVG